MRRLAAFLAIAWACCLANQPALAGKRVALVIGNSSYQSVAALANPVNDAAAVADMFKSAAFDVVVSRRDLKSQDMRRALREFTDSARGADIAVIYFAGHGLEVDGSNYVVPVDAVLERDADVDDEAVSLNRMLLAAEPASKLRLVILDACRDNPFAKRMKRTLASRAVSRGLVGVEANRPNTFIAFAAREGSTAADGDGEHSPFTTALLKHLTRPGLDIRKAFGYVRDDVMSATGNQQEPYTTNSLGGNDVALVAAPESPPSLPAPVPNSNADIRRDYELAERVGTMEVWNSFIEAHPSGFYADLAKAQRNKLADAQKAKPSDDTKIVTAEPARPMETRAGSDKPDQAAVAMLPPAPVTTPEPPKPAGPTPQEIARSLQRELRRVGCKAGDIDDEWSASARKALSLFNENAGTKFDAKLASLDALDAVRAKPGRVCPLECDRGFRASGDHCVKITCDADQVLAPNGSCRPKPERAPKAFARQRTAPGPGGGRKCFVYNGTSFCE
jgi:predicted DsbA family dithiol-disulfide isomerase